MLLQLQPANAEGITYRYKASQDPLVRQAQAELVQTYALVKYYYVDGTFNGTDWDARFQAALAASAEAPSAAAVRESAAELLQALGDPYTRILSGASASISDAERNGQVFSYGLGVKCAGAGDEPDDGSRVGPAAGATAAAAGVRGAASGDTTSRPSAEPATLRAAPTCRVEYVVPGSAAAAAGVASGDYVTAVGGRAIDADSARDLKDTLEARDVPALRLQLTTAADADVPRPSPSAAGANPDTPMAPAPPAAARSAAQQPRSYSVELSPAAVGVDPVQISTVTSPAGRVYGYIRVGVFSPGAADRVAGALAALPRLADTCPNTTPTAAGAGAGACTTAGVPPGLLLDLRDNPGGSLAEGIAAAALFEPRREVFMYVSGRDSPRQVVRIEDFIGAEAAAAGGQPPGPIMDVWRSRNGPPIVVLVNRRTASSSELLAAALRAGRGAHLLGETTVGKGRTQRNLPIGPAADGGRGAGATLVVSVGRFEGAGGERLEEGGLKVGTACEVEASGEVLYEGGEAEDLRLEEDLCVSMGMEWLDQQVKAR